MGLVLAHQLARVKLQTLIFFIRQEIFLAAENILVTARMCTCRMGRGLVLLLMGPFRWHSTSSRSTILGYPVDCCTNRYYRYGHRCLDIIDKIYLLTWLMLRSHSMLQSHSQGLPLNRNSGSSSAIRIENELDSALALAPRIWLYILIQTAAV